MTVGLTTFVLLPWTVSTVGAGLVFPGVALGVAPGVTVTTQLPPATSDEPQVEASVVPLGSAGEAVTVILVAVPAPVLVMVIRRGLPVSAGFRVVLMTLSARAETLAVMVVEAGVTVKAS